MIYYKSRDEIKKMRQAGKMAARLLNYISSFVVEGKSTEELDVLCDDWMRSRNLIPATLDYNGFPKSICTSLNNVVCHGIPKKADVLKNGDIINIDVTVIADGYHGDTSCTYLVGDVSEEAKDLVERTEKSLYLGIDTVRHGSDLNDIGVAIEAYVKPFGYGIVRDLGGHGLGKEFHEAPFVHHYDKKKSCLELKENMTFTIEPMINQGGKEIFLDEQDNWTIYTQDFSLSAQFEHTLLVTKTGCEILTVDD